MDSDPKESTPSFADRSYALSGRIMLSAIVVLFFVVIVMICLHLYARWYLLRARRRQMRRRNNRRNNLVFYVDQETNAHPISASSRGLDASLLKSLPVFVYYADTESIECAVCLSEFEEKEEGRTLPQCKHSFHTECIDMWFHSHSTCPLCRSPVEPVTAISDDVVELVSPSDLCNSCPGGSTDDHAGPSTSEMRKPMRDLDVRIDVPRRNGNFGEEPSSAESPASQGFRSPMSRMLSFTRILNREWRGNNSPRSPIPTSCGGTSASEEGMDLERGKEEETRPSAA
ncbi:RING-H2 finger protein ATL2 [Linum grandiflorum]